MKIIADRNVCEGYGQCCFSAPEIFELDPDGKVLVLNNEPDEALRADAEGAADACPVQAIMVRD
jgi:ferredoxin